MTEGRQSDEQSSAFQGTEGKGGGTEDSVSRGYEEEYIALIASEKGLRAKRLMNICV
jgi:hypothetical protein